MADVLGDYMKSLEEIETDRRGVKGVPIVARLDGRSFSTFTKGLERPYDHRLTQLMRDMTKHLVYETNALIGYTQSDEVSLVWYLPEDSGAQYFFDGRFQKLTSILSSMATGYFVRQLDSRIPEKAGLTPTIDARVWSVPTLEDAGKTLMWREKDAIKNSITMLASVHFSHNELHKINSSLKKEWLREKGDPWELRPSFFRKGSYFKRMKVFRDLTPEELSKIPEDRRPSGPIERSEVREAFFGDLESQLDLTEIFK